MRDYSICRLASGEIESLATFISGNASLPPPFPHYIMSINWENRRGDGSTRLIVAHTCFSSIDVYFERYLPPDPIDMYMEIVTYLIPSEGFQIN